MLIDSLEKIESAPAQGYLLAYTRKEVVFEEYTSIDNVKDKLKDADLLEIHLFNDSREYRAIASTSKKYPEGMIEYNEANFKYDFDAAGESSLNKVIGDVYREDCLLEKGNGVISVLNHLGKGEDGMVVVDDYRLVMRGDKDVK